MSSHVFDLNISGTLRKIRRMRFEIRIFQETLSNMFDSLPFLISCNRFHRKVSSRAHLYKLRNEISRKLILSC